MAGDVSQSHAAKIVNLLTVLEYYSILETKFASPRTAFHWLRHLHDNHFNAK